MRMLISAKFGVFPARGDGGGTAATTRTLPAAPPVSVGAVIKARIAAMVVGDRIRPGEVVLDVLGSVDSPPLGQRTGRGGAGREMTIVPDGGAVDRGDRQRHPIRDEPDPRLSADETIQWPDPSPLEGWWRRVMSRRPPQTHPAPHPSRATGDTAETAP